MLARCVVMPQELFWFEALVLASAIEHRHDRSYRMSTILITGASSGIGKATALYFADQGWTVAATMRNPTDDRDFGSRSNVTLHALDVTDETTIQAARDEVLERHGAVDVVMNNAGYALMGPFEAASAAQIEQQFTTNVFGVMNVTRAFLPHFRDRQGGLFLNVSSIGGVITFPLMSLYHASKWAVEGFSESVAYELGQLGIRVKLIEPGGVATNFGGSSMTRAHQNELYAYDAVAAKFGANMAALGIQTSTATEIAAQIFDAATDGTDRLRYAVGTDAKRFVASRAELGPEGFVADMSDRLFDT